MADRIKIENHTLTGGTWFAAWLFVVGYLDLNLGQAILALLLWPYYLGQALGI